MGTLDLALKREAGARILDSRKLGVGTCRMRRSGAQNLGSRREQLKEKS